MTAAKDKKASTSSTLVSAASTALKLAGVAALFTYFAFKHKPRPPEEEELAKMPCKDILN